MPLFARELMLVVKIIARIIKEIEGVGVKETKALLVSPCYSEWYLECRESEPIPNLW